MTALFSLVPLAYIGPETILPATSALAAAGGVLLLAGRHIKRFFGRIAGCLRRS
jgi:hypothetical protein